MWPKSQSTGAGTLLAIRPPLFFPVRCLLDELLDEPRADREADDGDRQANDSRDDGSHIDGSAAEQGIDLGHLMFLLVLPRVAGISPLHSAALIRYVLCGS